MFDYELFLYRCKLYCHWVDSRNRHGVNILEEGRGFFWSSFPCVEVDMSNVMNDREHWYMLPLFHTLAWRNFGVGYGLVVKYEDYNDPSLIEPSMFKTLFHEKLANDMDGVYIEHLGQFRNYGGVVHFEKVESREDDVVFWLDGLTAEVVRDMLS